MTHRNGGNPARSRTAFTLIELSICSAIAMLLAGFAISTFYQLRRVVSRSEARQAMYSSAQSVFNYMQQTLGGLQQSCAVAVLRVQRNSGAAVDPGEIRLVFMRSRDSISSYRNISSSTTFIADDLTWELWSWKRGEQSFSVASNSIGTTSNPGRFFVSGSFTPEGVNYNGRTFYVTAQARRVLDPADPTGNGPDGLDGNILFPGPTGVSRANALEDVGDYTDLQNNLAVAVPNMSDLSFEIVTHGGTTHAIDDSSAAAPLVFQGVWLDGRMAPSLTAPGNYALSELIHRPRLLRMRFTLTDPKWRNDSPLSCTFSFSFPLPGLTAQQ